MVKVKYLALFLLSASLTLSCEKELNNSDTRARGAIIHNMPDWLNNGHGYASDWKDWQGESCILLHKFVPETIMPDSFNGKYRLYLAFGVQDISIGFNDIEGTTCSLLYNWYDRFPRNTCNSYVNVPQDDPDTEFSFECYAKTNLSEESVPSNKSHVSIVKENQSGSKYAFRYVQTIAGKEIINAEMFRVNFFTFDRSNWLPKSVIEPNSGEIIINFCYDFIYQHYHGYEMLCNGNNYLNHQILSAEGLAIRSCNDSQQIISFNLLDYNLGGFAEYFTFKRTGDIGELSYYKTVDNSPVLIKEYKNLICKDTY